MRTVLELQNLVMGCSHTTVGVSDLEATRAFSEDELGPEHSRDFVGDGGVTNDFVCGERETQFEHDPGDGGPVDPGDFDHVAVSVEDPDGYGIELVEG